MPYPEVRSIELEFLIQYLSNNQKGSSFKPNSESLLLLLRRHKLLPLSEHFTDIIPDRDKDKWKKQMHGWTLRSMQLFHELHNLCLKLNNINIYPVVLKGPVLSVQLFGQVNKRQYSDLDLLIGKEHLHAIIEALNDAGYSLVYPNKKYSRKQWDRYFNYKADLEFWNETKNINIEVHTSLISIGLLKQKHQSILQNDPITVSISNYDFPTLNPENNFIFLCLHGSKHLFFRLTWLRDIASILNNEVLNHKSIIKVALALKLERTIAISLILARKYFNVDIPCEYGQLINQLPYQSAFVTRHESIILSPGMISLKTMLKGLVQKRNTLKYNTLNYWLSQTTFALLLRKGFKNKLVYVIARLTHTRIS